LTISNCQLRQTKNTSTAKAAACELLG